MLAPFPSTKISETLNESLAADAGEVVPSDDARPAGSGGEPRAASGEDVEEPSAESQTVSQ